jgi:hypothetical protein
MVLFLLCRDFYVAVRTLNFLSFESAISMNTLILATFGVQRDALRNDQPGTGVEIRYMSWIGVDRYSQSDVSPRLSSFMIQPQYTKTTGI